MGYKGSSPVKTPMETSKEMYADSSPSSVIFREADLIPNVGVSKVPEEFLFAKKYELTDVVLGSGAYAVVKLARDRIDRHKVAVKCVDSSRLSKKEKDLIETEVTIYQALDHPNIMRFYDFFKGPKHMYMVLEYVRGGELFDEIVKRSHYTESKARELVHTLLTAIKHCHDKHIAHRDLKPENILMLSRDDDSSIKIADFGFARVCHGNSLTDFCGSAYYVAPEIVCHEPHGLQVDIWSIGVIAYMLLAGTPPFNHPNTSKLFAQIETGVYDYPDEVWKTVSASARDFIDHLLVLDPKKRYSAQEALAHPWLATVESTTETGEEVHLGAAVANLKKFQALRKFRVAGKAVLAINRLRTVSSDGGDTGAAIEAELVGGTTTAILPEVGVVSVGEVGQIAVAKSASLGVPR